MEQIEQFLRTALGIKDDTVLAQGRDAYYLCSVSKGEHLVRQGEKLTGVAFLISGLFRFYYIDSRGADYTDCFCGECGYRVVPAIDFNSPLPINIQALENSIVLVIPIDLIQSLTENNIEIIKLYNRLLIISFRSTGKIKWHCTNMMRHSVMNGF